VLHVFGEDECTDITCGKKGGENKEGGDSEERRTVCGSLKHVAITLSPNLYHLTDEAIAAAEDQVLHAFGEDECTDITGEASAVVEAQVLHAFREDECTDITCEGRKKGEVCEDGRRESAGCARIKRSEFIHRHNQ
jgi:hypothetical protein